MNLHKIAHNIRNKWGKKSMQFEKWFLNKKVKVIESVAVTETDVDDADNQSYNQHFLFYPTHNSLKSVSNAVMP